MCVLNPAINCGSVKKIVFDNNNNETNQTKQNHFEFEHTNTL